MKHDYARREAVKALDKAKERDPIPGDVVAGLPFGFWRGFYFDQFEGLWRAIIREVYPH